MKYHKFRAGEKAGTYVVNDLLTEVEILEMAKKLSRNRLAKGRKVEQPAAVFSYLQALLREYEHEVFAALFLDNRHRVIRFEELFRGTLDSANVYPREVAKRSLELNAAAIILVHNHPSGDPEPSETDKRVTARLKEALALVDVKTLDHVVVGTEGWVSLAERGCV